MPWQGVGKQLDKQAAIAGRLELQEAAPHHDALQCLRGAVHDLACAILEAAAKGLTALPGMEWHLAQIQQRM